jgi:hypothetical protein
MLNQFRDSTFACDKLPDGRHFCMYDSEKAPQGAIAGSAILNAYGYTQKSRVWLWWALYSSLIILAHRILGFAALWWRVRR